MSLIAELKRRNVFKVGIAYVVVAWLILQLTDVLSELMELESDVGKIVIILLVVGFVPALIFAWAFELTPDGVKREKDVDRSQSITLKTDRKLNFVIIGALAIAAVSFAVGKFALAPESAEVTTEQIPAAQPFAQEKSIAVLPFVNMSADPDNEFFSDGISEEILNVLAGIPDLKVAARTSAFEFKGQNRNIAEIGRLLNVSNVLEGSVRKAGSRVRVTAQLVKVDDGFHLWSDTYDRELTDIFAIQDEIAAAIANAMKTTLNLSMAGSDNLTGTNSIQAYEFYLQGMRNWHQRELSTLRKAEELFLRAIEIDPGFAKAHAGLALTYAVINGYSSEPQAPYRPKTNEAAGRALAIDPRSAEALAAMGFMEQDSTKALSLFEQAIAINPSFATAYHWYGIANEEAGNPEEERRQLQHAFELDPRSRIIGNSLAWSNLNLGHPDDAFRLVEQMKTFAPDYNENLELEFILLLISGQREAAAAVGKRLAEILNKKTLNLGPYLDLLGDAPQREAASEVLLSWPRGSRMEPDSHAILYDAFLVYVLAVAGQNEPALKLMTYLAKRQPRLMSRFRWDPALASFNCTPDVQAIYASFSFASPQHDYSCPESAGESP